jgi:hypothetical protein
MNNSITIFILVMISSVIACRSTSNTRISKNERELLKLGYTMQDIDRVKEELPLQQHGIEYPPLLPPDKAHKVSNKLQFVSNNLNQKDISEIFKLVGRVPGFFDYDIYSIVESRHFTGVFDVHMGSYTVRVKKEAEWRVFRIN